MSCGYVSYISCVCLNLSQSEKVPQRRGWPLLSPGRHDDVIYNGGHQHRALIAAHVDLGRSVSPALPLGIYIYLFHVIPHQILITRAVKLQHQFSKSRGFKNFPHVFFKVYHRHILSADFFKYDHK